MYPRKNIILNYQIKVIRKRKYIPLYESVFKSIINLLKISDDDNRW